MTQLIIPGGREQGTPVGDASDRTLEYWSQKAREQEIREACAAELERRGIAGEEGPPSPAAQTTEPQRSPPTQRRPSASLARVDLSMVTSGKDVSARLEELAAQCHLVSPATASADLPEGFSLAVSVVKIDPRGGTQVVYPTGNGNLGLARASLEQIAGAAGISWDLPNCRRVDDGRDPHYCSFAAAGYLRNLDGSVRAISGTKEMDLRDGSAQVEALYERFKNQVPGKTRKDPTAQIREMRLHIQAHAETKAKLRAIRSIGIRSSYTAEELAKPFAVVRLAATGRTEDLTLKREFARLNYAAAVAGSSQLYGAPPAQLVSAPTARALPARGRPVVEEDDFGPDGVPMDDF
jgi:hypothetical protein